MVRTNQTLPVDNSFESFIAREERELELIIGNRRRIDDEQRRIDELYRELNSRDYRVLWSQIQHLYGVHRNG